MASFRELVSAAARARLPWLGDNRPHVSADVSANVSNDANRTTAYRVVNSEGDGLPGLTLDRFDAVAVLSLYRDLETAEEVALLDAVEAVLAPKALYVKRRPKEARVVATTLKDALAPELPARGTPVPEQLIREEGLSFLIRPAQGLSVGLYLDMRDTRSWLRKEAAGRSILNLFAYTCAFGVAARAGGAARVLNVDLSRRVLSWGQENAHLNQQPAEAHDFLAGDVFDWLARLAKKGETFDTVILDPPSFATSRKTGAFSVAKDYARLAALAAKVTAKGGQVLACCNHAQLSSAKFEVMALEGFARAGRPARILHRLGPSGWDFPPAPGKPPVLKVLACQLG